MRLPRTAAPKRSHHAKLPALTLVDYSDGDDDGSDGDDDGDDDVDDGDHDDDDGDDGDDSEAGVQREGAQLELDRTGTELEIQGCDSDCDYVCGE